MLNIFRPKKRKKENWEILIDELDSKLDRLQENVRRGNELAEGAKRVLEINEKVLDIHAKRN